MAGPHMPDKDVDLADLAERITAEHAAAQAAGKGSVRHAVEVGRLLVEAVAALPFRGSVSWLGANTPVNPHDALEYMKLSRRVLALDPKTKAALMDLPSSAAMTFLERLPALQQLSVRGQTFATYVGARLNGQPPALQCEAMIILTHLIEERGEQPDCFLAALLGLLGHPDFSTVGAATDQDFDDAFALLEAGWKEFCAHEKGRH